MQGVGFRPFVHAAATALGLGGFVGNDVDGVFVEAEGEPASVAELVDTLRARAPALATVETITMEQLAPRGDREFVIVASPQGGPRQTLIAADTATCADCLSELFDPADRRFRYPFTNCTNCGPRFTIVTDVPYDRPATTMVGFAMCAECAREYADPADRRFHAQPVCCPACGPTLRLLDRAGRPVAGYPIEKAAALLSAGAILAVKGLGGYHLAADATDEAAVSRLRRRKLREDKPFALMVADLDGARRVVAVDEPAAALLTGRRRPVVLLPSRRGTTSIAPSVAPGNRELGVLLPYTPLHHLLARELGRPFVLTSGNVSDEPIAFRDDDARERLAGMVDGFLTHDRPIHVRTDDSVVRLFAGRELPLRRSRGYVPEPLALAWSFPRPVLACGAELKSTFCLGRSRHAFVSHHIGDLQNYETFQALLTGIEHFRTLFDVRPEVVAHDLHPDYLSTQYAVDLADVQLVGVQHHHAHIAACLADHGETGPVIGVAFDGTGLGDDGTLWGGELLVADLVRYERVGHLDVVPLPGGAAAIREPWRMAAAYLQAAYGADLPNGLDVVRRNESRWAAVTAVAAAGVNAPLTSSAGRLFDAVAALVGIRDAVNYEGQAAVELEQRVDLAEPGAYPARVVAGRPLRIRSADLVCAAADDVRCGIDPGVVAARFHNGLADVVAGALDVVRGNAGLSTVALSGGVFQNVVLLTRLTDALTARGFRVLVPHRVPPNDAGISFGQAAVAAARDRAASAG